MVTTPHTFQSTDAQKPTDSKVMRSYCCGDSTHTGGPMARFIQIAFTEYDARGIPAPDNGLQWLNADQIVRIEEHLGNNLARRHRLEGAIPEQHYPCLLITTTDGHHHLASLGVTASQHEAVEAIRDRLATLVGGSPDNQTTSTKSAKQGRNILNPGQPDTPAATEAVEGYTVPIDPMDELACDSCQ